MANSDVPGPVAAYLNGMNAQDPEAVAACFHADAVVRDEGKERRGSAAIREWAEEVGRSFRPTVEVLDVVEAEGRITVLGRVSGDFPGSPIDLRHAFALQGGKIDRLEIG